MARLPNNRDDFDPETELTRIEAEAVAKRHGIDIDRVLAIYKRTPDTDFFPVLAPFQTNLDRAITILGKDKALQLFETEDLGKLAERVFLVDQINHFHPPLYSLDELQQAMENFILHLLKNRIHLLDAGQPLTKFDRSFWLDWQLGKLYHFDFPAGFSPPPREDQARLKADRGKLLDLKVAILKIISHAIKHQASATLWEDCLREFTSSVSAEEAEFYLSMDQFYLGYDFKDKADKGAPEEIPGLDRPGGLTDLFEVIGQFEKELTIGTLAKTRNALADLLTFGQWNRPILFVSNYFEAIDHPLRDTLDSALDLFSFLELKEGDFWEDYRNRVNDALQNEFYGDFIYRDKVKRKFIHQFQPEATNHLKLMKVYLEATGRLPGISISPVEVTDTREEFVFRKEKGGDFWTIIYEGKACPPLRDMKGFQYIAFLLGHSGEKFSSFQLDVAVDQWPCSPPAEIYSRMTEEKLSEENLRSFSPSDGESKIDLYQYMANYNKMRKRLLKEKHEAELDGDKAREERIQGELENLDREIYKIKDDWNTLLKRSRKAVLNCMKRSLDVIKLADENLWRHLYDHIHTGMNCSYTPPTAIPWKT